MLFYSAWMVVLLRPAVGCTGRQTWDHSSVNTYYNDGSDCYYQVVACGDRDTNLRVRMDLDTESGFDYLTICKFAPVSTCPQGLGLRFGRVKSTVDYFYIWC